MPPPQPGPSGPQGADLVPVLMPRAAHREPWRLLRGEAKKVSVFLARRGCPPVAAALPALTPARWCAPAQHSCPRREQGAGEDLGSSGLPQTPRPSQDLRSGHPWHRAVPTSPTPASLCPCPLPGTGRPAVTWGLQHQHLPLPAVPPLWGPPQIPTGFTAGIQSQLASHPPCPCQAWHAINVKDFLALPQCPVCALAAGNQSNNCY